MPKGSRPEPQAQPCHQARVAWGAGGGAGGQGVYLSSLLNWGWASAISRLLLNIALLQREQSEKTELLPQRRQTAWRPDHTAPSCAQGTQTPGDTSRRAPGAQHPLVTCRVLSISPSRRPTVTQHPMARRGGSPGAGGWEVLGGRGFQVTIRLGHTNPTLAPSTPWQPGLGSRVEATAGWPPTPNPYPRPRQVGWVGVGKLVQGGPGQHSSSPAGFQPEAKGRAWGAGLGRGVPTTSRAGVALGRSVASRGPSPCSSPCPTPVPESVGGGPQLSGDLDRGSRGPGP